MNKGLVSVIMPTYNSASFIKEAIRSVIRQTYTHWELIIIDDGSKDNTQEIVTSFTKRHSQITYVQFPKNMGVSRARNHGISIAKGQYLAFLDSDDVWLSEKLATQISFLRHKEEASFVFSSYRRMSSNGDKISRVIPAVEKLSRNQMFKGNNIPLLTVMIDREHFSAIYFNEKVKTCEDYCLWLELLKQAPYAFGIDADLARYRNVKDSVSNTKTGCVLGVMYIYFILEFETIFLSIHRFFQYAINGIAKRAMFPINLENKPEVLPRELFPSMANILQRETQF